MNNDTKSKFAELFAAAKTKTAVKTQPTFTAPKVDEVKPVQKPTVADIFPEIVPTETKTAKMVTFTILWQEGSGKFDGKVFTTWNTANDAMKSIYNEHKGAGYLKVKVTVKWENGSEITDRCDCSDSNGDFCPKRVTIGEYLQKQNSVMYASNLNVGDRVNLSFEDTYLNTDELTKTNVTDFINSPNFVNDFTEMSTMTIADLIGDEDIPTKSTETAQISPIQLIDYSDKAIAIIGETKPIKEQLKKLGGRFNPLLKCGAGWIFPKSRITEIKKALNI